MRLWEVRIEHVQHFRDARITHAKVANPTTLLTRFAEELPPSPRLRRTCRRAPEGGGGGDYSFDLEVFSEVSLRSCL